MSGDSSADDNNDYTQQQNNGEGDDGSHGKKKSNSSKKKKKKGKTNNAMLNHSDRMVARGGADITGSRRGKRGNELNRSRSHEGSLSPTSIYHGCICSIL